MRKYSTCHNFHKVPEQNHSIPAKLLHWTCKDPPPSVLPRWLYPDWWEQPEEVVFDSWVTSSVLPPTSWYSWECGWRYSWSQSLDHRCSRRRAWWWWHLSLVANWGKHQSRMANSCGNTKYQLASVTWQPLAIQLLGTIAIVASAQYSGVPDTRLRSKCCHSLVSQKWTIIIFIASNW